MAEVYVAYTFKIAPLEPGAEILLAELSELDFESFEETAVGLEAYIIKTKDHQELLNNINILSNPEFTISYSRNEIAPINWNSEWERNFDPIDVEGICYVRAPFHSKNKKARYEIVITPKMSFGTGHHATTHLMIKHLLRIDLEGKKVLDMGCGTGILAILAAMRGAAHVEAIDNDPWCYENALENCSLNNQSRIEVRQGDAELLIDKSYDLIIANINRNVLVEDLPVYARCLREEGTLLLSGFYTEDIPTLTEICNPLGINFTMNFEKNNWVACKFVKN